MKDQLTIRLPRELNKALKEKAARMQRKPSDVVRMAVAEFLQVPTRNHQRAADRVRDLIGSLKSGVPDLAENPRKHILKKLRSGR